MKRYQITYCPYIYLNQVDEIQFTDISIWNFDRLKNQKIQSNFLIEKIEKLLQLNRTYGNKRIRDIGIISIKNKDDFIYCTPSDIKKIQEFKIVLFLISLAKMPNFLVNEQITSDNFITVVQNFTSESSSNTNAVSAGRILNRSNMGEILFHEPHYLNNRRIVVIDKTLLKSLSKIKKMDKILFRRIIRATESIMNSYYNNDDISEMSRILEISRSFEILFNLPDSQQRKHFKIKVGNLFRGEYNKKRRFKSERRNRSEGECDIKQVMWADRFYILRNHIIHGEKINNQEFKFENQEHLRLGIWFFLISVKKLLNISLNKKIFYDTIIYNNNENVFEYDYKMILKIMEEHNVL